MNARQTETTVLLQRWHHGEQEALNDLLAIHHDWIRSRVRQRLGPKLREKNETVDYVQDVALDFLRYGPKIQISDSEHLRALLGRIIENNLAGDHHWWSRKRRDIARETPLPTDTILNLNRACGPATAVDSNEREAWVRLGLELLEPDDRDVIVLRNYDGLAFAAIGGHLKISADAARMRYQRAVSKLGREVGKLRCNGAESLSEGTAG